ncbi:hypothetical protein GWI33_017718 [Rhynchophorus ferrugineus]|uniref:Uncharacterized protein n=1 Tax=Rhynchophorus ferrugineus TaxID=354439 RepID=A0A834I8S3_RHYFE|nr:hypothetical protein GWI33_017718 [Rhynchophorus ferrugineus]
MVLASPPPAATPSHPAPRQPATPTDKKSIFVSLMSLGESVGFCLSHCYSLVVFDVSAVHLFCGPEEPTTNIDGLFFRDIGGHVTGVNLNGTLEGKSVRQLNRK